MKNYLLLGLVSCIILPGLVHGGLLGKSLVFSTQTDNIYVKLLPNEFSQLTAFTLCLRVASEEKRGYSLLSYATNASHNEFLLWQEGAKLSVYFGSGASDFALPANDALLRHICVSWESSTGTITFWLNGVRSLQKVVNSGGVVRGGGTFILGQEQDQVEGKFDSKQSFVGELTDGHLWDHVLSANDIKTLSHGCHSAGGNIINWDTVLYESRGNVNLKDCQDCSF